MDVVEIHTSQNLTPILDAYVPQMFFKLTCLILHAILKGLLQNGSYGHSHNVSTNM